MWEHYKKTFLSVQALIVIMTVFVHLSWGHVWMITGLVFLTMQVSAIPGALWGNRLRNKFLGHPDALPAPRGR
jgi:hypothetical protein